MNLNPFKRKCRRCEEGEETLRLLADLLAELQQKREFSKMEMEVLHKREQRHRLDLAKLEAQSAGRLREARRWKTDAMIQRNLRAIELHCLQRAEAQADFGKRQAELLQKQVSELRKNIYRIKTEQRWGKS